MEEKSDGSVNLQDSLQGGLPSNTPLANSKESLSSGGEDTAHVGLFVVWKPTYEVLFQSLDRLKEAAQNSAENQYLETGSDKWLVSATGFRQGGEGKKGPMLRWKLQWGGFVLGIQNRDKPAEGSSTANVWLQISSETLMAIGGLKPAYELVEEKLRVMGGTIVANKLSRVDACADLPGVPFVKFAKAFNKQRYVTRALAKANYEGPPIERRGHGRRDIGFSVGGGIRIRAYDKLWEVRAQPIKKSIMMDRRWGGPVECATRVEFQLRRSALKTFGVDSVSDWLSKRASVVRYLCEDWFRITSQKVDRGNTTRGRTAPVWKRVTKRFRDWTGESEEKARRIVRKVMPEPRALVRQARGCLLNAMACCGLSTSTLQEVRDLAVKMLFGGANASEILGELEARRLEILALKPGFVMSSVDANGVVSE